MQFARQFPQMLTRVKEIDNLHCAWKVLVGNIPNPFGAITHDHLLFRVAPVALTGFHIQSLSKRIGGFDGADVSGGIRIADGVPLLIPSGLGEDAAQLDLSGVRGLSFLPSCLAAPPSLSSLRVFPSRPFARTESEPACPPPSATLTGRLAGSPPAPLRRYPLPWLPPSAPRLWWSPPDRRATSSAGVHGRRASPPPPPLACGARRGRTPYLRCPARRRRGTGRCGSAGTSSKGATPPPYPPRSGPAWSAVPGSEPCGHKNKGYSAGRLPGLGTAAVGSARLPRRGAWQNAPPSLWPPDPGVLSCVDH